MVKITDPNDNNKKVDHKLQTLTQQDILSTLNAETEENTKTSSIHLRLNNSIANQIRLYANEHETTVTSVITDVLTKYYSGKRIIQGVLELDTPVNLIIPTSAELISDFIEHDVDLLSDVTEIIATLYNFNEEDIQRVKKETKTISIHQVNNLLDMYIYEDFCYSDIKALDEDIYYKYHRGLIIYKLDTIRGTEKLLIEVCTRENTLLEAKLINLEEAVAFAEVTDNYNLVEVLHEIDVYSATDIFNNRIREIKLEDIIKNQNETIEELQLTITHLEEEADLSKALLEDKDNLEDFVNNETDEKIKYFKQLELENTKLKADVDKYRKLYNEADMKLDKIEDLITGYLFKE